MSNHFMNLPKQVQAAPQGQKTTTLINGIAQQMQASDNQGTQQLGDELQSISSQLISACQQQG